MTRWVVWVLVAICLSQVCLADDKRSYPDLILNGQVQLQYDAGSLKALRPGRRPARNGLAAFPTDDRISVRRARLIPILHLSPSVSVINETDFSLDTDPENVELTPLDLFVRIKVDDHHHIRAGQFKVPFGYEFFRSSRRITTVERSDVSRTLFQRDIGVGFFGDHDNGLTYGVAVFQGQGENEAEENRGKDIAGRVVVPLSGNFKLGASTHLGTIVVDGQVLPIRRFGAEAHFRQGPVTLAGEYIVGDGYNLFADRKAPSRGYTLTGIYRFDDSVDGLLSYDRFDPDVGRVALVPDDRENDRSRFLVGVNYYFSREPVQRIMFNYEFRQAAEGPSVNSSGPRLRYQYAW